MSKWARISNGTVAEITDIDPTGRFHPSIQWVEFDGRRSVAVGWLYDGNEFSEPTPEPQPEPEYFTYKNDMWPRCTEEEAEIIDAQIEQAPVKMRRMFNDANKIEHNNEYFPLLRENMIAEFGEARTDEILAPSNGG